MDITARNLRVLFNLRLKLCKDSPELKVLAIEIKSKVEQAFDLVLVAVATICTAFMDKIKTLKLFDCSEDKSSSSPTIPLVFYLIAFSNH